MYLAMERESEGVRFFLRHSSKNKDGVWISTDVFDLGSDPEEYVEYIDERVFLISSQIEDALYERGIKYDYADLEEIFWPFIDPVIRQRIDDFGGIRGRGSRKKSRFSREELRQMQGSIHPFDRRRMLFLKFLQINIEPLMGEPLVFLNRLLNKSRDELEQNFKFMEMDLRPWELKAYVYAIFALPGRFSSRLSRFVPDAQDQGLMDDYFIEELCRMNSDPSYLDAGARPVSFVGLHPYLRRYAIRYFDVAFKGAGTAWGREYVSAASSETPSYTQEDNLRVMGMSKREFDSMSEREFVRFYKKQAQRLHPDKGGEHESFIRLKEAFESLLVVKKW